VIKTANLSCLEIELPIDTGHRFGDTRTPEENEDDVEKNTGGND
jgi:hypothetical protein